MKLTVNFQTLIMLSLTVVLAVATAIWGAVVYRSIYDIILHGFDQKLIALGNGAAEFTDGDGHAAYQEPREIVHLLPGPAGQLWGWDGSRAELVAIDPGDGGALALPTPPMQAPRSLAFDQASGHLAVLSADGTTLHTRLDPDRIFSAPDPLPTPADQLLAITDALWLRRGRELTTLTGPPGKLRLAEEVSALTAAASGRLFGIAAKDGALLEFAADGELLRRVKLQAEGLRVQALACIGDTLYAAGSSLLRIDPEEGTVAEDFAPGWFSERDPWFARLVPAYRRTRELAGLTFLYTLVYLGGDQIRYIMDGSLGEDHSPPGYLDDVPDVATINDYTQAQARGQGFVSDIREWEEWGLIKVAGEPIYDHGGRVVAIAGADVDIGVIRDKTRYALFSVIFVGAGLLLLAGSVSLRVSQGLTRPLREIKDSALRIAAGYHGSRVAWSSGDEIGQLAQSLDALSTRLAAQARQSVGYQRALASGREQIALENALTDLVGAATGALPPRMQSERPASEHAACAHGEIGMLWTLASGGLDPLRLISQQAHVQSLARTLLQRLAPAAAQDALLSTMPMVTAVACWDSSRSELRVRTREELTLLLIEADGSARSQRCGDQATVRLMPGQRLAWADGLTLVGAADTETGAR
ncbi:MAG: HAMP domain-containing protein [Xanthomonadales bacterium]|nr:hypothetical protein [Xanthomonadales bacterium]MCC6592468.1 HAMP domain-containing protein [Xanthomonadales bacterium]MCE7930131.1 HAMP domain-containing protein [Xanthomonadales bacterium PRO6]